MNSHARTALAGAVMLGLALTGCSSTDGGDADTDSQATTLTFWGWAPGYAAAVEAFNAAHPDINVSYQEVPPGAQGGYEKMLNAVRADDAPCLAQVGYESLSSFAAQGALTDVSEHAQGDQGDFQEAAWEGVSLGDAVYGAPVDLGPMGLFYNKAVYDELGLEPPATWDEYREQAKTIHESDPDRFITSPYLNYDFAGFAWQEGASWFETEGDAWRVTMDSEANERVAEYWQSLIDDGLIAEAPMYDQSWYTGLGSGDIVTVVGAVWQAGVIKGGAQESAGDWAVAPMPKWDAADTAVGNAGGASTAVLAGCYDSEAAWTFAHWMSTDRDAFGGLINEASLFPAATGLLDLPELQEEDEFFGGQRIFEVFAGAAPRVDPDWTWGPLMNKTTADLDDALSRAWAGDGTVAQALAEAGDKTVAEMNAQGLNVVE